MWYRAFAYGFSVLAIGVAITVGYGSYAWKKETDAIRARLEASRQANATTRFDTSELDQLPPPVQRYFRAVLAVGQPMIVAANLEHQGTFNMSASTDDWKPFTSTQRVVMHRAGFDWDGSIQMLPGIAARVHDAYVAGEGILHATVMGAFPLTNLRGTPELAQGEFMRFVAESVWYPTRMLPSQGATWQAVDNTSARLTMQDGTQLSTLLVSFGPDAMITSMKADSRGRTINDAIVMMPWQVRVGSYGSREGMQIPLRGEVEWLTPEGAKPYWRGHITAVRYQFSLPPSSA
jgi:hypothetical protein